jgi:DeoR family glycerol-3-phosphate regulon repressor
MAANFRQVEILEKARRDGRVLVEELARHFDVTVQTIRRDLTELSDTGKLERVHGGAVIPSGVVNIHYEERRRLNEAGKAAIADACAAAIPDGSSVFLGIGTTTEAVARALAGRKELMVVTNNLNVAEILSSHPDCQIVVVGGLLRRLDGGLVGGFAVELVRRFKFDHAVIGCSALDADGDLLDFDEQEIAVTQAVLARARHRAAVVDLSKLDRKAPIATCALGDLDVLYTDGPLPPSFHTRAAEVGTRLAVAPPIRAVQSSRPASA